MSYLDGRRTGSEFLSRVTGVDMKSVGQTTLYTVPTGKSCVVTEIIAIPTVADAVSVNPEFGIGTSGGSYIDWDQYSATIDFADTAVATSLFLSKGTGAMAVFSAGAEIKIDVTVGATATTSTSSFYVFGFLI